MTQIFLAAIPEAVTSFLPLIGIVIVFYLFFIRPQNKQRKETQSLLDNLKKGDIIVTVGGIHGKLFRDDGDILIIEVDTNTKLKIEKSSVSLETTKKAREAKPEAKI